MVKFIHSRNPKKKNVKATTLTTFYIIFSILWFFISNYFIDERYIYGNSQLLIKYFNISSFTLITALTFYTAISKMENYLHLSISRLKQSNENLRSAKERLHIQLKEIIIGEIKNGNYEKDAIIPTEKEFIEDYQISRTTVRQAITELVQEGWLYRVKSKGTFVSFPKINHNFMQTLESFNEQMDRVGSVPKTEVLELKKIKASEVIASKLGLGKGEPVVYLYRRRFADNEPIVLQKTYLSCKKCGFILDCDFTKDSLYKSLARTNQTKVVRVQRIVEVDEATNEDAENLEIAMGKPIQSFTTTGFNVFGEVIEFSLARYRGDRSRFEVSANI